MAEIHDIDFDDSDKMKGGYIKKFLLYPPFWNEAQNQIGFDLNWKRYKFSRRNHDKIDKQKGIYCFVVQPKMEEFFMTRYLFYIGKTNRTLHKRFGEYLDENDGKRKSRVKIKNMMKKYDGYIYYFFTPIQNRNRVNEVEDKLIDAFIPHVNVQINRAKINPQYQYIYE